MLWFFLCVFVDIIVVWVILIRFFSLSVLMCVVLNIFDLFFRWMFFMCVFRLVIWLMFFFSSFDVWNMFVCFCIVEWMLFVMFCVYLFDVDLLSFVRCVSENLFVLVGSGLCFFWFFMCLMMWLLVVWLNIMRFSSEFVLRWFVLCMDMYEYLFIV